MEIKDIKKGQYVVYGTNGICLVDDITEMAFPTGGERKTYFLLRPCADAGSVIYIPHDNEALLSRLRPTLTKPQAEELLAGPVQVKIEWIEDRKQRVLALREYLAENNPYSLLPLIRCLCHKRDELTAKNKKFSNADREALDSALHSVCNELCFATDLEADEIIEKLKIGLNIAL